MTLKPADSSRKVNTLTARNFSSINGSYDNVTSSTTLSLGYCLLFKNRLDQHDSSDHVTLKVLDEKYLRITVLKGSTIIKQKRVKGKLLNDGFEFKAGEISSFWLLVNAYRRNKARIRQSPNGDLVVDVSFYTLAFLTIMPFTGSANESSNNSFPKRPEIRFPN